MDWGIDTCSIDEPWKHAKPKKLEYFMTVYVTLQTSQIYEGCFCEGWR